MTERTWTRTLVLRPVAGRSLRSGSLWAVLVVLVLGVVACNSPALTMTPEDVVDRFYRWYIGYPGNPLADREYRASPYLTKEFIEKVDSDLAAMRTGGVDPFLGAQDVPERFEVGEAELQDGLALVPVAFYWSGNPSPSHRNVELELDKREWKICRISLAS